MNGKWTIALALMTGSALPTAKASVLYVDSSLSNITVSGSGALTSSGGHWTYSTILGDTSGGFAVTGSGSLVQQAAGSLTTSLAGTIDASETAGILTFSGASISANDNGTWKPDGSNNSGNSAPAELAGQVTPNVNISFTGGILGSILNLLTPLIEPQLEGTNYLAARSIGLDVSGSTVLGSGGSFDTSSLTETFASGFINIGGALVSETWTLTGLSGSIGTGTGTFTDGIIDELILPFDWTLTEQLSFAGFSDSFDVPGIGGTVSYGTTGGTLDITMRYVGQLVAHTRLSDGSVPEPASLALFGLGLAGLAASRRRRTIY